MWLAKVSSHTVVFALLFSLTLHLLAIAGLSLFSAVNEGKSKVGTRSILWGRLVAPGVKREKSSSAKAVVPSISGYEYPDQRLMSRGVQRGLVMDKVLLPPYYYEHHELDIPPYALEDLPDDPAELRGRPDVGKLVLELWIDDEGVVRRVELVRTDLPDVFIQSGKMMFMGGHFAPAKKAGVDVHAKMLVELMYGQAVDIQHLPSSDSPSITPR